jgi:hypothetical protein
LIPAPFWKTEKGLCAKSRFSTFRFPFDFDFRMANLATSRRSVKSPNSSRATTGFSKSLTLRVVEVLAAAST